jgi:hypothetical protein
MRYGFDLAPASSIWNCSDGVVVFVVHFIIANIYFDSDMSKSTNTVVCFDWKTVIYIYVCGICRTQFMLPKHVHLRPESQSHAPAHVLMSLYQIDKSLVFITKRKKDVILEYEIFNDPHDAKE